MIVRCERCETRFKLDESRLPARGARVRCSRCKHAFFVVPPGSSREDLVHEAAAEAAGEPEASTPPPEPAWDLEDNAGSVTTSDRSPRSVAAPSTVASTGESEDDNDWRFESDVPGIDPAATRSSVDLTGSAISSPPFEAPDANEDSFAELGDPETWDLLSDSSAPDSAPGAVPAPPPASAAVAPETVPTAAPASPAGHHRDLESPAQLVESPAPVVVAVATRERPAVEPRSSASLAPRLGRAARGMGWAAVAALSALVLWLSLSPRSPVPATPSAVAGFAVSAARARILENAGAGPILVVSGRLRNPGPDALALGVPLRIQLLDEAGTALPDASAVAGPALAAQRVREEAPEELRAQQAAGALELARRPVVAGGELAFDAVFSPLPPGVARFALTADEGGRDSGR